MHASRTMTETVGKHEIKWKWRWLISLVAIGLVCVPRKRLRPVIPSTTPKFGASTDPKTLNVHIVPHTHDDVGWLKTVEEYYYGRNQTIQHAHVQAILSSVVEALVANPNRTFTYVEQKFFSMWWEEQSEEIRTMTKDLIHSRKQLSFANGGWCMHDEASTHYIGMIDQTTLGHDFLKRELGVIPRVGWQLDPFGHSSTQASYMTSMMGFDALYFGRIDKQDLKKRHEISECEGLWKSSPNLVNTSVFWGLTGSYEGNYGPPAGFCFDISCGDDTLVGMDDHRLLKKIKDFVQDIKVQSGRTKGNNIMMTMGSDFQYEEAQVNFANYDLLISLVLKYQESKQIDVSSILGPRFDKINIFYSNPDYYTQTKYEETTSLHIVNGDTHKSVSTDAVSWTTKSDDFFPYSDCDHCFWTGYFTSRTGFKRLERVGSSFLLAARQIESMVTTEASVETNDCHCMQPLYELEDALGVAQHHDAVSGTGKQHVANDYARRVQAGIDKASSYVAKKIKSMLLSKQDMGTYLTDLEYCQLLNETKCHVSEEASRNGGKDLFVVVYNGLSQTRSTVVGIPLASPASYVATRAGTQLDAEVNPLKSSLVTTADGKLVFKFDTGPLPPTGAVVYQLILVGDEAPSASTAERLLSSSNSADEDKSWNITKGALTIQIDNSTGALQWIYNSVDGSSVGINQEWGYYTSFNSELQPEPGQNSGAYIFRPSKPDEKLTLIQPKAKGAVFVDHDVVSELHVEFEEPWIKQVTRLYEQESFVEIEYTIGPIPIDDGIGKEIVTRYSTCIANKGVFFADSNGREFQRRERSFRPTWNLTESEPVAGNYYPVNAAIYIEDHNGALAVATDRSQGGASLVEGSIELMVQRRNLADDSRGVGEPMNETVGGMTPYPPYGNAMRMGEGIVIRGKHRLIIGSTGTTGATLARREMDAAFSEPAVFVASSPKDVIVPLQVDTFSLIQDDLPANVMLITFSQLHHLSPTTYLIRVGHQYAKGENKKLSQPAQVCLGNLMSGRKIVSITEKTLSGNQDYNNWVATRYDWGSGQSQRRQAISCVAGKCMVELQPMEIRTFEIQVEPVTSTSKSE